MSDRFAAYHELLEEADIPLWGVRILVYIDEDGEQSVRHQLDQPEGDEVGLRHILGVIEQTKLVMASPFFDLMAEDEEGDYE
jgi:hypothetical protein